MESTISDPPAKLYKSEGLLLYTVLELALQPLALGCHLHAPAVTLAPRPAALVPRAVDVPVHPVSVLFAELIAALVDAARAPGVLALPVVLAVAEVSLVGVGVGLEHPVALKLAVQELALELVAVFEADLSVAVLEVVVELSLVDVLADLLQPALPLEAVVPELALVDLLPVRRHELALLQLVVLEYPGVGGLVLLEDPQPARLIVLPGALVKPSLRPLHPALPVLGRPQHLPDVNLASLVPDPEPVVGKWLYVGVDGWSVSGLGDVDGEGRPGGCGERVVIGFLGEGLAFLAELGVTHRIKR